MVNMDWALSRQNKSQTFPTNRTQARKSWKLLSPSPPLTNHTTLVLRQLTFLTMNIKGDIKSLRLRWIGNVERMEREVTEERRKLIQDVK